MDMAVVASPDKDLAPIDKEEASSLALQMVVAAVVHMLAVKLVAQAAKFAVQVAKPVVQEQRQVSLLQD